MTPGEKVDKALTLVHRASGPLGTMVVKRFLSRSLLRESLDGLEQAVKLIQEVLAASR